MTDVRPRVEPEPIDAEFEPAEDAPRTHARRRAGGRARMRSRAVTWPHLITASAARRRARRDRRHHRQQRQLQRADRNAGARDRQPDAGTWTTLQRAPSRRASTSSRCARGSMRRATGCDQQDVTEAVAAHRSCGAGQPALRDQRRGRWRSAGRRPPPAKSPLGILLAPHQPAGAASSRTRRPRPKPRAKCSAPSPTCRGRWPSSTLPTRRWSRAFDRREAALAALETGMQKMAARSGRPARRASAAHARPPSALAAASGAFRQPVSTATTRAQTIRALSRAGSGRARPTTRSRASTQRWPTCCRATRACADIARPARIGRADARPAARRASTPAADARPAACRGGKRRWLELAAPGLCRRRDVRAEPQSRRSTPRRCARRAASSTSAMIRDAVTAVSGLSGRAAAAISRSGARRRCSAPSSTSAEGAQHAPAWRRSGNAGTGLSRRRRKSKSQLHTRLSSRWRRMCPRTALAESRRHRLAPLDPGRGWPTTWHWISENTLKRTTNARCLPRSALAALMACSTPATGRPTQTRNGNRRPKPTPRLQTAIANPARSEANKVRDTHRHPAETLAFFGLKPGMTVIEIAPGQATTPRSSRPTPRPPTANTSAPAIRSPRRRPGHLGDADLCAVQQGFRPAGSGRLGRHGRDLPQLP